MEAKRGRGRPRRMDVVMSTVALDEPEPAEVEAVDEGPDISTRCIEAPIASSVGDGYAGTSGFMKVWLGAEEQAIVTRLMIAMKERGETLKHHVGLKAGRVVSDRGDAIRVLVQRFME